jgi:hypothetical protein
MSISGENENEMPYDLIIEVGKKGRSNHSSQKKFEKAFATRQDNYIILL